MFITAFKDANQVALIFQGIYDLLPVIFFLLGSIILLRTLYHKMVKGCYCLLAAGSIMVVSAGCLKALHKILMGVARIDYIILDKQFTPTQSVGFFLLFLALLGMFTSKNKDYIKPEKLSAIALPTLVFFLAAEGETALGDSGLPAFTNLWPFLIMMILGAAGFLVLLVIVSVKMHTKIEPFLFSLSILFMIGMGYLSTKRTFEGAWMQISCNVVYQLTFFLGCLLLKRHHLETAQLFKKKNEA